MKPDDDAFRVPAKWSGEQEGSLAASCRLLIRPAGMDEVAALVRTLEDWAVAQWLLLPHPIQPRDIERLVIASGHAGGAAGNVLFCVREKQTGEAIGGIIVNGDAGSQVSLRYWLQASSWGRGIATEALSTMIGHIFACGRARTLHAFVDPENLRSLRVLKRLGFRPVECRRRETANLRGARSMLVCECTPADFASVWPPACSMAASSRIAGVRYDGVG
jgi:RimJ/RimL family protein N-acetyltransferase